MPDMKSRLTVKDENFILHQRLPESLLYLVVIGLDLLLLLRRQVIDVERVIGFQLIEDEVFILHREPRFPDGGHLWSSGVPSVYGG